MEEFRKRAQLQIKMGEKLAAERGLDRNDCVDAAHFLIDDGRAAYQGDDPEWVARVGLSDLYPDAVEIERKWARSWSAEEWAATEARLRQRGNDDAVVRLLAHRSAS
jgi:hypothetical protein